MEKFLQFVLPCRTKITRDSRASRGRVAEIIFAWLLASAVSLHAVGERYDLSGLPAYVPAQRVQGVIRIWGNDVINLVKAWEVEFKEQRFNSEARFQDYLLTTPMGFAGPATGEADIGYMGHSWWRSDLKGFEAMFGYAPLEIKYANGSFDEPHGSTPCPVFFVNQDNPLRGLTLEQLDGIYGAERTGGWQAGMNWVTEGVARGPEGNLRTWGQLGLGGEWADKPIVPYGPPSLVTGAVSFFQTRVSGGAGARNEKLREYDDRKLMMADLARDRYGIAYGGACYATADTKPIAIAETDAGPFVLPTRATVADRSYPLFRAPYIYFTIDTKTGDLADPLVEPKVREFLRYILSKQGQQDVAAEGDYLPLTAEVARAQLALVENPPTARAFRKDRR